MEIDDVSPPARLPEINRRIDDLKKLASEDPAQVQKILPSALQELKAYLEVHSSADEEALRESEENYRLLFESMVEGYQVIEVLYDEQGKPVDLLTLDINPACSEQSGIPIERAKGQRVSKVLGDLEPAWLERSHGVVSQQKTVRFDEFSAALDRWYSIVAFPLPGKNRLGVISSDVTDRKRAEEARRDSEERFRALYEHNTDGIVLTDPRHGGKVLTANPAACTLFGWSEAELMGKTREELFDLSDPAIEALVQRRQSAGVARGELTYRRKDGSTFPGEVNTALFTNSHGEPRSVSVIRDMSERKKAEEELTIKEAQLDAFFANSPAVLNLVDEHFCYINTDKLTPTYYGLTRETIKGKCVADLSRDFINQTGKVMQRILETGEPVLNATFQAPVPGRGGAIAYWNTSMFRVPLGNARWGVGVISVEVTDSKRAEKAVEVERRRLFDVLEGLPVMVCLITPDYHLPFTNQAFREKFGESHGRHCYEYCYGKADGPCEFCESMTPLETGKPHHWEAVTPDGSVIEAHDYLFTDVDGSPMILEMDIDITERKRAEEALRKSKDELEIRVQERTAELLKAKDAAEAAARTKTAFLANMSHELRTPMNYIIGMTSLLLEEPLTQEQKDYVEVVRKGGNEMMSLINDILDVSKLDKEKTILAQEPVDLTDLISESIGMVASSSKEKGLRLNTTIDYEVPKTILGDYGRLKQILVNLLTNAIKFTDKGGVSVSVSSQALETSGKYQITFAVKDTGIGISPESQSQLFQPFTQVDMTISRRHGGAGLGLAISKRLVELMGGRIWFESKPGEGSTFYFTIEAEVIESKSPKPITPAKSFENLAKEHPLRILVAEDNPSNQKVIVEMLKRMGYRADAVANGLEAIQTLEIQPYDLVLMDVRMPEMDGIAATREIRKRWPGNGPKVIAITAYALEGDREKCIEAGMDGYIAKPVDRRDLVKVLKDITLNRLISPTDT